MTKFTKISTSITATLLMTISGVAMADGAALYKEKGCGACHGADGNSPIMPAYPKIAGQTSAYLTQQMTDIKTGDRSNGQSAVMKGVMASISDDQIAEISTYLSGLK